jgi:hypothetical protein
MEIGALFDAVFDEGPLGIAIGAGKQKRTANDA